MKNYLITSSSLLRLVFAFSSVCVVAQSHAAKFKVGEVNMTLQTEEFKLQETKAEISCYYEDGSGGMSKRVSKEIDVVVTSIPSIPPSDQPAYQVRIASGKVSHMAIFTKLRFCSYVLMLKAESSGAAVFATGQVVLAGSQMTMSKTTLDALLSDSQLGEKISKQNQPLVVIRKGILLKKKD